MDSGRKDVGTLSQVADERRRTRSGRIYERRTPGGTSVPMRRGKEPAHTTEGSGSERSARSRRSRRDSEHRSLSVERERLGGRGSQNRSHRGDGNANSDAERQLPPTLFPSSRTSSTKGQGPSRPHGDARHRMAEFRRRVDARLNELDEGIQEALDAGHQAIKTANSLRGSSGCF